MLIRGEKISSLQKMTFDDAILKKAPLIDPSQELNEIILLLKDANDKLSPQRQILINQLKAISKAIYENCGMCYFHEILLVLDKGVTGGYGTWFGNLDIVIITQWFREYITKEREGHILAARERQKSQETAAVDWSSMPPHIEEKFQDLRKFLGSR